MSFLVFWIKTGLKKTLGVHTSSTNCYATCDEFSNCGQHELFAAHHKEAQKANEV